MIDLKVTKGTVLVPPYLVRNPNTGSIGLRTSDRKIIRLHDGQESSDGITNTSWIPFDGSITISNK